ncbi:transcriptional repressor CTCFL-like [Ostrinia nubilalis]|uniref:transcriptional repressor CTCFL-like n=1 Tax=Ostrinia nubilalis TaxID=29057 RepID=UPI00308249EF
MRPFKCCHCDYTAARKAEMALHLRSHTEHCSVCKRMKLHMRPFKCCHCDYTAARNIFLSMARKAEMALPPALAYRCHHKQRSVCKLEFSTPRRMELHMAAVHDKLRPFKCCHCDYTAARKAEMALHLRSHTDRALLSLQAHEAAYAALQCCHCDYTAARKAEMALHLRSHTGQ